MDIYIYYWGQFGHENLYPEHVFDWSLKVVNCPTEDYSVGGVSNQVFTFTSDLKLDLSLNGLLEINYGIYYVAAYEHINNADRWKYTCIPCGLTRAYYNEWDTIIPDSTLEQWAQRTMTLNDLFHELCWGYTDRDLNNLTVNSNYVINTNFGYSGITRRQVMQWVMQLTGGNIPFTSYHELVTNVLQPIYRGGTSRKLLLNPSNVKNIQISDFEVPQIDKIWFGTDASDVGLSYGTGKQQLSLPYNPLINPDDDSFLQPLYDSIRSNIPAYTPMKVELFNEEYTYEENGQTTTTGFSMELLSGPSSTYTTGDQLCIEYDDGTNVYTGLVFNYEFSPGGITLECTGNPTRELSNSLISNEIAQSGKYNKFKRTLDETVSEIANLNGDVSTLNQTAASLTLEVAGKVGANEIISTINQTAETITIDASKINLNGAVAVSASAKGGDEEEGDTEADSLRAMLTIEPTQSQMASDYSRSGLYNNCFSISKYNSSGTRYANARMYADNLAMGGVKITDPTTQSWYRYNTVYLGSNNISDSSLGYGRLFIFNPAAMETSGATANYACVTLSSNSSDNEAVGSIILSSTYGTSHVPHIYFYPDGYKTGAQDFARIDNEAYKFYNNVNGGTPVLQAQYDKNGALFPHQSGTNTMYGKEAAIVGSTSSTTTYSYTSPSALYFYNGNTSPNASYTSTGLTVKSNNSTTTYSTLSSSLNLYDGNIRASLVPSGITFYEDNGSGTSATKGHYTGKELTVGLATSGSTYTVVHPAQITWNNSGQSKVNKLVPEGASVVEHGTSSGWTYRKWSDGTYECWKTIPYSQRVEGVWDDDFYVEVNAQSYPVTFASAPYEVVSISSGDKSLFIANTSTGPSTTKTAKYLFMRPTNAGTTITVNLTFYVKGVLP